jgi:hexosaminidase
MSFNKMNVLHLHLSDNCRYAVESSMYPRLTSNLTGIMAGHYTHADINSIVQYAADRGIRVIPEIDLPGHSQGMQGLSGHGLVFCANNSTGSETQHYADLRNDDAGSTIATLKNMYRELASLFPDEELFIGADETAANGPCSVTDYKAIEHAMCDLITTELNRTVGGWEEYAFETGVAVPGEKSKYLVNTWHYHTQSEATARGFRTVAANDSHFYLVYGQPAASYWVDIADGLNATQRRLLLGGTISARCRF